MTLPRAAAVAAVLSLALALPGRAEGPAAPVVVELFTSQGCNSCPPADAYLGELARQPGVLALAFHVDYWDYLGWKDPYASHLATLRQNAYAGQLGRGYAYTPQMVVQGSAEGVGVYRGVIARLIAEAAKEKRSGPEVALAREKDGTLAVHVGAVPGQATASVWLASFDPELSTPVARGENGGRTLREYQVVRSFAQIGNWRGPALDLAVPATAAPTGRGIAVLVQEYSVGRILAAGVLPPAPQS